MTSSELTAGTDEVPVLFSVLGPFRLWIDGRAVPLGGPKAAAVLARLVAAAGSRVSLDRLVDGVWGDDPPMRAEHTVQALISRLRKLLAPAGPVVQLVSVGGGYALGVPPELIDGQRFERRVESALATAAADPGRGRAELEEALALWKGQPYEDVGDLPWARDEATRLAARRAAVYERWCEIRLALGEHRAVLGELRAAAQDDPLNEHLSALLATALYRGGQQAEALRTISDLRSRLRDELGLDPGPEMTALESAILRQDAELLPVLESRPAPPAAPADGEASMPARLPRELTSFVGRQHLLAALRELLGSRGLVSLSGPGGTGKTRLALRAAADWAAEESGEAWLVELGAITDPRLVERQAAAVLGVKDEAGAPLTELIGRRLTAERHLVVLDNCEQVVEGAADLAHGILHSAGDVRILATTREPLSVPGEAVVRVPPLQLPTQEARGDPIELASAEAVQLFVDRARSHDPEFRLDSESGPRVASVCAQLDGIPLAIELAAARLRVMSLADVEARLSDRFRLLVGGPRTAPARHRTLRALIDWSYGLLADPEREVLCRLTVFSGGWDLDLGEEVMIASGVDAGDALGALASLVDKSLVDYTRSDTEVRYRLAETVAQYAADRLAEMDPAALHRLPSAHAHAFLRRAESAVPHFAGRGQVTWRRLLEPDHDNLLRAFAYFLEADDGAAAALRFGTALSWFWTASGRYAEGFELLQAALDRADAQDPTVDRCEALNAAGHLAFRRGELSEATRRLQEARAIADQMGSSDLAADALRNLAWVAQRRRASDEALTLADEAVRLAEQSGNTYLLARSYDIRAVAQQERDPDRALSDYTEALRRCQELGDTQGRASVLNNLAVLALDRGDVAPATAHFEEALAVATEIGDDALVPYLLYGIGLAAILSGKADAARPRLREALRSASHTGQQSLVAYGLGSLAVCEAESGRAGKAALLHGASVALFRQLNEQPERLEAGLLEKTLEDLRSVLGERLQDRLNAGERLPIAEAVALAVGDDP